MYQDFNWLSSELLMQEETDRGALLSNRLSPGRPTNHQNRRLAISEDGELRLLWNTLHRSFSMNEVNYTVLELASACLHPA